MSQEENIDLQALTEKWYARLKAEGFNDIEQDSQYLKCWHSAYFHARHSPQDFELQKEYFRKAGMFFHDYSFSSSEERSVWGLHAEGLPYRKIASHLRDQFDQIHKDRVKKIVCKLKNIMHEYYLNDS